MNMFWSPKMIYWVVSLGILMQPTLPLSLRNNGYEDLLVAIHKNVPQNVKLVSDIKEMFRSASPILYEALDKRAYFRKVTILVPTTWSRDPTWKTDNSLSFKDADVRVDQAHPSYGDTPYTLTPGQCGEQGRYIHFTPKFLLNKDGLRDKYHGDAGRVFVHEFAHYRYGVFDEYGFRGNKHHPLWYLEGLKAKPTVCSRGVKGVLHSKTSCAKKRPDGAPTDDCIFMADVKSNTTRASIMTFTDVKSVTRFCKTEADTKDEQHNFWAPNQHNKMCKKQGTYDVIMNHADFRLGNPPREDLDVTPTFEVVQSGHGCGRRTVLVLDLSGSMYFNSRYFKLAQAGDRLIRDILPSGTAFGIVAFTNWARVRTNMTVIADRTVRNHLANDLPGLFDFGGGTNISSGLDSAVQLLQTDNNETKGANIVLITDGETDEDLITLALPSLLDAMVVVHTIALGPDAESTISVLATETGGTFSYYSESSTSTALDSAMRRLLDFVELCEDVEGIEIERLGLLMSKSMSPFTGTVEVDDSVGHNTLFSFVFPQGVPIMVKVNSPDKRVYDSTSPEHSYTNHLNIVRFQFPFAKNGTWGYTLETLVSSPKLVTFVATSSARPNATAPIEAETKLNTMAVDLSDSPAAPVVYTHVHRGYQPVLRAKVTVTVDRTPSSAVVIQLKDDGVLPDNREDDGVYTAYFTQFTGNQRISMQARVQNIPGQTALVADSAGYVENMIVEPELKLTGDFTRTSSPGAVDVSGFNPGMDYFPPGTVTDLRVVTFDTTKNTVTLTWTSPGDDFFDGKVERYELRMAEEFKSAFHSFNISTLITETDLKQGNFTPLLAGSPHTVVVSVPSDWPHDSYVFGLKAFDEANRTSDLSSLPSVTFKEVILPEGPTPLQASDRDGIHILIIAILVAAVILEVLFFFIFAVFMRRRKRKKKSDDQTFIANT